MGGGSLYDVGCYSIHAIRSILQAEPIEVQATADMDSAKGVNQKLYPISLYSHIFRVLRECL